MRIGTNVMGLATVVLLSLSSWQAQADVPMYLTKPGKIKINGVLKDWGATRFRRLSSVIKGSPNGISMRAALSYDSRYIYVGASVVDPTFIRTSRYGDKEDHAALLLSFPNNAGQYRRTYEVKLFAGKSGETAGQVRAAGSAVSGAELVEAPSHGGYRFEAKIPWNLFPPAATNRTKVRGVLRY
ncbi:MAG: hypothetical protein CSA75_02950, partial [Sorangium cellulosum]